MSTVLFPYATLSGADPTLTVSGLRLDGTARPLLIKSETATAPLYDYPKAWKLADLDLQLSCDSDAVRTFEAAHGPVTAVVVANCLPTNTRQPLRLTRSAVDPGRWSGTLELDRDNFLDRIALATTLTAMVDGVPHRPVAMANSWTVYADEPESLHLRGTLQVKWKNFKETTDLPAKDFPEATHVLAFTEGLPELWLNSAFTGLESLLKDRKDRKGTDRGLHDVLRAGIARTVWLALIADALAAVRIDESGDLEPDWPETPWQSEVLKMVLSDVAPGQSDRQLLGMAAKEWRESPGAGEFYARAEAVTGDIVKANAMIRRLVQSYSGGEETP